MFSTSITAFVISFLSIAATSAASPLAARVPFGCRPNFEGVGVSVVNQAVEWGLPAGSSSVTNEITTLGNAEFRFEFNGSPANTFVIKSLEIPQWPQYVLGGSSGFLELQPENLGSPAAPDQSFYIGCQTCQTGASGFHGLYASGCSIASVSTGSCVQTDGSVNDKLTMAPCNSQPAQLFDFYTV